MQQDQRVEQATKRGVVEQPSGMGTSVDLLSVVSLLIANHVTLLPVFFLTVTRLVISLLKMR